MFSLFLSKSSFLKAGFTTLLLSASTLALASPAPEVSLPDASGQRINLKDLQGKVVLVDFWASWCGPCRQSFPWMNSVQSHFNTEGFTVLAINVDENRADAEQFLKEVPSHFPVVFDPKGLTPEKFAVQGMPTSFLINRQGEIVSTHIGFNSKLKPEYERAIKKLIRQ